MDPPAQGQHALSLVCSVVGGGGTGAHRGVAATPSSAPAASEPADSVAGVHPERGASAVEAVSLDPSTVTCYFAFLQYNAGNPAATLVIAAGKGLTDCIKCLLKAGADANISDEDGKLLVQVAACQGWKECVEILFPVTTPLAEYATWSIDGIIQHEKTASSEPQVSDLDDKENAVSDDNTNKDKQPHQSKLCSEKGKALTTVEENGGGIETLMSGLNLGPEDPSDKAWRSTRARQHNVRINGPEWAR
ncbi:unnamed protein product [Miscanthus lutarioriparius]|uniref:Uncharacterized protein n=1 Tax=Miscanthus lutarioriparius TaxID=422564 RepID=A0A811QCH3_9POAL|nr:unnamed protein product [Miscanthus lutarioriparius]